MFERRRARVGVMASMVAGSWLWGAARASAAGTDAASFLSIPVGGRPAALGGAYSAMAEDAYAPVWNPAGLGHLPGTQLSGMHLAYADSIGYEFVSFAQPLGRAGGLGASVQYLHPKDSVQRDAAGNDLGALSAHFASYSLAYGLPVGDALSLGAAAHVIDESIAGLSARTAAGDVGGLYRVNPKLSVAAVAANLGGKVRFIDDSESLPDTYRLGLVVTPAAAWSLAAEAAYDRADAAAARLGAEWRPMPLIALRAGYRGDSGASLPGLTRFATGVGLTALGQRFDYAWVPMGYLGDTQYFSVVLTFGKGAAR